MALTELQVKNAKEGFWGDSNGLYLRVQAGGSRAWIFRYQLNGKRREMGIGWMPLADARAEAAKLKVMVKAKLDPIEQRNAVTAEQQADVKQ